MFKKYLSINKFHIFTKDINEVKLYPLFMKRIFTYAAIIASTVMMGQEQQTTDKDENIYPHNLSVNGMLSDPSQFGLSYEFSGFTLHPDKSTNVVNISYAAMNYDAGPIDVNGSGLVIELGHKSYYNKERPFTGIYTANYLSYGNVKFDETFTLGEFEGNYSYFSFFNPEIGYKIVLGNFVLDPFIGAMWKIEIKGKGDVDNKNVDEWAPRAGIKIGYNF